MGKYNMFVMFSSYMNEVTVISMLKTFDVKVTRKRGGYEIVGCNAEQRDILLEKASRIWAF